MKKPLFFLLLLLVCAYSQNSCQVGQIMVNNRCVPLTFIEGCALYSPTGQCQKCEYGYTQCSTGCLINPNPLKPQQCCAQRDNKGNCKKCALGLYLENNVCKRNFIDQCVFKLDAECKACGKGFYLKNNKCMPIIEGCEQYNAFGICLKCSNLLIKLQGFDIKYQLINGICIKNKIQLYSPLDNSKCKQKNSFGCVHCQKDYYLTEARQCLPYQQGCLIYFRGKCKQCSAYRGFVLDQTTGKCVRKFKGDPILNCIQYDQTIDYAKCLSCKSGFRLSMNKCVDQKNFTTKCKKQCNKGFYLTPDYQCKSQGGNLIKQEQEKTSIKQPGCIYQYGKCQFCQSPFIKVDGKCTIQNCRQIQNKKTMGTNSYQCVDCRYPFVLSSNGNCIIPYCSRYQNNRCAICQVGYHSKVGQKCVPNDVNCKMYNKDGYCEKCDDKYFISSTGQCQIKQANCLTQYTSPKNLSVCTACADGYFLNRNNQCQKNDPYCQMYVNGVCKSCLPRYFLWEFICFPYTIGCVKYSGKSCVQCKKGYSLFNAECFNLNKIGMKLQGQDDNYNFDIYPLDITKNKYYIENLSPASAICQPIYSSIFSNDYKNPLLSFDDSYYDSQNKRNNGWKALTNQKGHYIGYKVLNGQDPVTFYALQLEFIEKTSIKSFYLEYTKDGVNWIRIQNRFFVEKYLKSDSPSYMQEAGLITIYFTGVYARAIRIVIDEYIGWPACKIDFFYYDFIRYRKIMNLKSLKYLKETIQTIFVDRVDNQLYINQRYFFDPQYQCFTGNELACFTGLELCQPRKIQSIDIVNDVINNESQGYITEFYLVSSFTGRKFDCYNDCKRYQLNEKDYKLSSNGKYVSINVKLNNLQAKNLRVYPTKWVGQPKMSVVYDYQ